MSSAVVRDVKQLACSVPSNDWTLFEVQDQDVVGGFASGHENREEAEQICSLAFYKLPGMGGCQILIIAYLWTSCRPGGMTP